MIWKFKDGMTSADCTSFPYAFRMMWNAIRKGLENGKNLNDMTRKMFIVAPIKDRHGDPRVYSYSESVEMAKGQGLLTADGQINSKEFKR